MLRAVADSMPSESFSAELVMESVSVFVCKSKEALFFWADTSCMACKVAATFCYLGQKYFGGAQPESLLDSSEAFKPDVVVATAVLRSARALKTMLDGKMAAGEEALNLLKPSVSGWRAWFERVGRVEALWGRALVTAAIDRVTASTGELAKLTPVYSHIVTEKKINVAMVKKILLQSKIRGPLSEKNHCPAQSEGLSDVDDGRVGCFARRRYGRGRRRPEGDGNVVCGGSFPGGEEGHLSDRGLFRGLRARQQFPAGGGRDPHFGRPPRDRQAVVGRACADREGQAGGEGRGGQGVTPLFFLPFRGAAFGGFVADGAV